MNGAWILLVVAGLLEVGWAIGLEYSHGFTKPVPTVLTVVLFSISMLLLGKAVQSIPIGTAYAAWTGIGAVGAVILGIILFEEPVTAQRLGFLSLVVVGIVGLNLVGH